MSNAWVIATIGPPDGTPGWHRRHRDAHREWMHSVQRAAFRVECQQLAYEAAEDDMLDAEAAYEMAAQDAAEDDRPF